MITSPGKPGCERSGTAADIQHPPAALRHLAKQQPVIIRVVIPVKHSQTLPKTSSRTREDTRLGCGAVSDPVFLELVEMLDSLQHDDDRCQPTGHPYRAVHGGHDWQ